MKRIISICFAAAAALTTQTNAQTAKNFFQSGAAPAVYLGVDFSHAKLIGDPVDNAQDIVARQFTGINEVIITEVKKYELKDAFRRDSLGHDLATAEKRSEAADPALLKSDNAADFHRFTADSVKKVLSTFDYGTHQGVGIVFVAEALSKTDKAIAVWVTLVDLGTKQVILTERLEGKTGMAFGFRNYWASPLKSVVDEVKKHKYNDWKSKYGG